VVETGLAYPRQEVFKHDKSSGLSAGQVSKYKFQKWQNGTETHEITVSQESGLFGINGDSGSLLVTNDDDTFAAVGVLTDANIAGVSNTMTPLWVTQEKMEQKRDGDIEWLVMEYVAIGEEGLCVRS
jgi:hypothetical protein